MARALSHDARLIIMDEPSAVLAHDEVEPVPDHPGTDRAGHRGHLHLAPARGDPQIGDRITVLKDGRTAAANLPAARPPTRDLVTRMTGRTIEYVFPPRRAEVAARRGAAAGRGPDPARRVRRRLASTSGRARSSASPGWSAPADPSCWRRSTALAGRRPAPSGGWPPLRPGSVGAAVTAGMGLAPEERKSQALLLDERLPQRHVWPPSAGTPASASPTPPGRAAARRVRVAGPAPRRRRAGRAHPLRRQPAEGRGRPVAAREHPAAAARRADPGRGRGRPGRALPGDPGTRRRGRRGVLVSSEVPRCSAWPTGCW